MLLKRTALLAITSMLTLSAAAPALAQAMFRQDIAAPLIFAQPDEQAGVSMQNTRWRVGAQVFVDIVKTGEASEIRVTGLTGTGLHYDAETSKITGSTTAVDEIDVMVEALGSRGQVLDSASAVIGIDPMLIAYAPGNGSFTTNDPISMVPDKSGVIGTAVWSISPESKPFPYGLTPDPTTGALIGTAGASNTYGELILRLTDEDGTYDDTDAFSIAIISPSTYAFTSHTFNTCGASGNLGPTLGQCVSSYSTTWDSNPDYLSMDSQGIQVWTVPETADYRITAAGAAGAKDPLSNTPIAHGARVVGTFSLVQGDKIRILVGQKGSATGDSRNHNNEAGGGGGSFVVSGANGTGTPLIIAGGAGGAYGNPDSTSCSIPRSAAHGQATQSTVAASCVGSAAARSDGSGGIHGGGQYVAGPGGGLEGNGQEPVSKRKSVSDISGRSFYNGGAGGNNGSAYSTNVAGGFGGGGSGAVAGGGGGGGYSGGSTLGAWSASAAYGLGGSSFNSGTNASGNTGYNSGHGYVTIQKL